MEFADILDRLGRRPAETDAGPARGAPAEFWHVLDGLSRRASTDPESSRAAYRANAAGSEPAKPETLRVVVAAAPSLSLDPVDIAFELDLDAVRTAADLKTVRRLFARDNHPDRVPAAERERANARMTIANALIDQAATRFERQ